MGQEPACEHPLSRSEWEEGDKTQANNEMSSAGRGRDDSIIMLGPQLSFYIISHSLCLFRTYF